MPRLLKSSRVRAMGLLALLGLLGLSTYNAVTTDRFAWDLAIARWVQGVRVGESLEDVLFFMGIQGVAGVFMLAALWWLWSRGRRADALVLLLILIPNGLNFALRGLYDRPRPGAELVAVVGGPQGASYPSGHGVLVVFLYGFLLYLLARQRPSKRLVWGAGLAFALYVGFSGLWLVNHGRHWPSDVFGGWLYGLLFLVAWVRLHALATAWEARHPELLTLAMLQRIAGKLRAARGA